jgi:hypothetical protein
MSARHVVFADHPHTDPGDGRAQCAICGKWVWLVTHSCKGIRVAPAAEHPEARGTP